MLAPLTTTIKAQQWDHAVQYLQEHYTVNDYTVNQSHLQITFVNSQDLLDFAENCIAYLEH